MLTQVTSRRTPSKLGGPEAKAELLNLVIENRLRIIPPPETDKEWPFALYLEDRSLVPELRPYSTSQISSSSALGLLEPRVKTQLLGQSPAFVHPRVDRNGRRPDTEHMSRQRSSPQKSIRTLASFDLPLSALLIAIFTTGCASVGKDTTSQAVLIRTSPPGAKIILAIDDDFGVRPF